MGDEFSATFVVPRGVGGRDGRFLVTFLCLAYFSRFVCVVSWLYGKIVIRAIGCVNMYVGNCVGVYVSWPDFWRGDEGVHLGATYDGYISWYVLPVEFCVAFFACSLGGAVSL